MQYIQLGSIGRLYMQYTQLGNLPLRDKWMPPGRFDSVFFFFFFDILLCSILIYLPARGLAYI